MRFMEITETEWTPTNPSNIPSGRNGTEILSSQFIEDDHIFVKKHGIKL